MNYKLLKRRMDKFFKNVTAEELIKDFEAMGYQFEKVDKLPIQILASTTNKIR